MVCRHHCERASDEWTPLREALQQPPFSMTLGAVLALREQLLHSHYAPRKGAVE